MHINNLMQILFKDKLELEKESNKLIKELKNYMKAFDDLASKRISKRAIRLLREKYQIVVDKYNLSKALEVLKSDIDVLNLQYEINKQKLENTSKIMLYIKYKQFISPTLMEFIQKRLTAAKIPDSDIIKTLEFIKVHNANVKNDINFRLNSKELFLVINILNQGYEEITLPKCHTKERLETVILRTINLIESNDFEVINDALNLDSLYNKEEVNYIYTYILKHYQEEIIKLVKILQEKEFYLNNAILEDIKNDYKELYKKYMFIRNILDSQDKDMTEEYGEEDNEDFSEELADVSASTSTLNLYYASNSNDPVKCYFTKDLIDLREEALPQILTLLEDFKNGLTSRIKYLKNLDGCIELKSDQIRIVLRPIGNKNYVVLGVFIKKEDKDRKSYLNIINRKEVILDENYSKEVEKYYQEYIKKNGRASSR